MGPHIALHDFHSPQNLVVTRPTFSLERAEMIKIYPKIFFEINSQSAVWLGWLSFIFHPSFYFGCQGLISGFVFRGVEFRLEGARLAWE